MAIMGKALKETKTSGFDKKDNKNKTPAVKILNIDFLISIFVSLSKFPR